MTDRHPDPMAGASNVTRMFIFMYKNAWDLYKQDRSAEAYQKAMELLIEPTLGRIHRAGMHCLLSTSSDNYVEHGCKAVQLYTEHLAVSTMIERNRKQVEVFKQIAQNLLDKAVADEAAIKRKVEQALANGTTEEELEAADTEGAIMALEAQDEALAAVMTNTDDDNRCEEDGKNKDDQKG